MWDGKTRSNTVGFKRDGRSYAYEFMPDMQGLAITFLYSYVSKNGGDYQFASRQISKMAHGHTLAKLIDELNYLRFTGKKTLSDIRGLPL
jgi:hypothetical protein